MEKWVTFPSPMWSSQTGEEPIRYFVQSSHIRFCLFPHGMLSPAIFTAEKALNSRFKNRIFRIYHRTFCTIQPLIRFCFFPTWNACIGRSRNIHRRKTPEQPFQNRPAAIWALRQCKPPFLLFFWKILTFLYFFNQRKLTARDAPSRSYGKTIKLTKKSTLLCRTLHCATQLAAGLKLQKYTFRGRLPRFDKQTPFEILSVVIISLFIAFKCIHLFYLIFFSSESGIDEGSS